MASAEPFWSLRRLTDPFSTPVQYRSQALHQPRPLRTSIVTEQHIETIGGNSKAQQRPIGPPRLPTELVICIVLLAAHDTVRDNTGVLQLASVNRACHTAILCELQLPRLSLSGSAQMRAFLQSLELNTVGLRELARSRVHTLTFRHHDTAFAQQQRPSLFDASSAQLAFERDCMPLVRSILRHLDAVERLTVEGVPRSLATLSRQKQAFDRLSARLRSFECLTGHYAGGIEPSFWASSGSRWAKLTHLQLHGPQFRFNAAMAQALSQLPNLSHLALVVPSIVRPDITPVAQQHLDLEGRLNPLQMLVDSTPTLQVLLLVGHTDKHFVGYAERLRFWLRAVHQNPARHSQRLRLQLVTLIPRSSLEATPDRTHPSEVSIWMMDRAQLGLQWSFEPDQSSTSSNMPSTCQHCLEAWDAPDMSPPNDCQADSLPPRNPRPRAAEDSIVDDTIDSLVDASDDSAS